jgi:hypothetical protein
MSKATFGNRQRKPATVQELAAQATIEATVYNVAMRLITAGGMVLQDTYGLTQEQAAAWAVETMRRANPENADGMFVAGKVGEGES